MEISRGKVSGAQKVLIYAPEGYGKSTFASKAEDPLFIDTEGSTKMLDVARFDADMSDWDNILDAAQYVIDNPDCCKTLVIDTIDWAENACIHKLNERHKTANILTLDYGKGSLYVTAEFERLLTRLDYIVEKGINVFLTAHAAMRKQELPNEMGAFDRWELKLQSKQVKTMVKEWADLVLFGNYKTYVVEDSKTKSKKAQGNKRVMYATHHPCWDAKNRHGLPDEMPFDFKEIAHIFTTSSTKTVPEESVQKEPETAKKAPETSENDEKTLESAPKKVEVKFTDKQLANRKVETEKLEGIPPELKKLMIENNVIEQDIRNVVAVKSKKYDSSTPISDYDPDFIRKMLIEKWDGMFRNIKKMWEADELEIPFN